MNEKYKQWLRDQYDKEMKDGINAIEFLKEWAGTGHEDLADGALRKSRYCAARAGAYKMALMRFLEMENKDQS